MGPIYLAGTRLRQAVLEVVLQDLVATAGSALLHRASRRRWAVVDEIWEPPHPCQTRFGCHRSVARLTVLLPKFRRPEKPLPCIERGLVSIRAFTGAIGGGGGGGGGCCCFFASVIYSYGVFFPA